MNTVDTALREKLAAIEHERWSDWQNWVHKVYLEGNFGEFMLRWQRQIATPYSELSDQEKASDLEQVDRYWPLIEEYVRSLTNEAELRGRVDEAHVGLANNEGSQAKQLERIAALLKLKGGEEKQ